MTSRVTALLDRRLAADPATPLLTYYDDATSERTELSATTLANWVAKTANLLQDGLDVEPGQRVAVLLPPHWLTAAVLLGAWAVGATVTELAPAEVLVTDELRLGELLDSEDPASFEHLVGTALHPLGVRMRPGYAGVTDLADALLYGDDFTPYSPVDPHGEALRAGSLTLTGRQLAAAAAELAGRMGLAEGDRLLVDATLAAEAGPVSWLLAPLAAGASIVLNAHPEPDAVHRRAATERVTVTLGLHVDGVRTAGS